MKELIDTIHQVLPAVINEVNTIRLPALETAWGRSFKEEMENEDQVTVEIAKNFSRVLNNCLYRHICAVLPQFKEHTTNGSDYMFGDILIEDKNSFSSGAAWVGNGFDKTPIHLLKKFQCDENGRIVSAFACIVDLDKCESGWSDKTLSTNRSTISFYNDDEKHIKVIYGSIEKKRKKIQPILKEI